MNSYERKLEARRERLEARADKARAEGSAAYKQAREMAEVIPFGQPILIGHHSEKRDRNYREKIHNKFGKAFELSKKADHYDRAAEAVGTGGISSDDPDAVAKLKEQLAQAEALQARMIEGNKIVRKHKADASAGIAALEAAGFTVGQAQKMFEPDFAGRLGFPDYALTNNGANIRRIQKRIAQLERNATRETRETERNGVRIVENAEENRLQLIFPGKPSEQARSMLKRAGFRWSPYNGAWQRHLNSAAISCAKWALDEIEKMDGAAA